MVFDNPTAVEAAFPRQLYGTNQHDGVAGLVFLGVSAVQVQCTCAHQRANKSAAIPFGLVRISSASSHAAKSCTNRTNRARSNYRA
jgi:hypothetical protein